MGTSKKSTFNMAKFAQAVFDEAQRLAPEASGHLKDSAKLMIGTEGFVIMYDTPYAYNLHQGIQQPESVIQHVSNIPAHRRQLKGRTVVIKEHKKTYKRGFKPVQIKKGGTYVGKRGDVWITQNMTLANQKTKMVGTMGWLKQAYANVRRSLPFSDRMKVPKEMIIRKIGG